jgi:hypothetical protein
MGRLHYLGKTGGERHESFKNFMHKQMYGTSVKKQKKPAIKKPKMHQQKPKVVVNKPRKKQNPSQRAINKKKKATLFPPRKSTVVVFRMRVQSDEAYKLPF